MSRRYRFIILFLATLLTAAPAGAQTPAVGGSCPADTASAGQPPKYKTAVVTWMAIYPLVLGAASVVTPLTNGAGLPVRVAAITLIVVPAMTWVAMPSLNALFHDWLQP